MKRVMMALALGSLVACASCSSREKQLERVARDWALTIRASQVIPVYPLTEDLVPGDMFLVDTPIPRQATLYRKRGYLPLDNYLGRIHGLDYAGFYRDAYWAGDYADAPHPRSSRTALPEPNSDEAKLGFQAPAPRAAFPTYSVAVQGSAGLSAALPIQGVPVAMSLINARNARASVTINDAYTYGIDPEDLISRMLRWAEQPHISTYLGQIQAEAQPAQLFVRVVQRVYLTGGMMVSIDTRRGTGMSGSGGAPRDVNLLLDLEEDASGQTALDRLNSSLQNTVDGVTANADSVLPGGTLKAVQVTARSVVMQESFDRPLVVGYLGYDFPILDGGVLGAPIATLDQLEKRELLIQPGRRPTMGDQPDATQRALNLEEINLGLMLASQDARERLVASDAIDRAQAGLARFAEAIDEPVSDAQTTHADRAAGLVGTDPELRNSVLDAVRELRRIFSDINAFAATPEDALIRAERRDAGLSIIREALAAAMTPAAEEEGE